MVTLALTDQRTCPLVAPTVPCIHHQWPSSPTRDPGAQFVGPFQAGGEREGCAARVCEVRNAAIRGSAEHQCHATPTLREDGS